jgi:hypothetical protein
MELASPPSGQAVRHFDRFSDLNPRDDLESLAFVLIYLLRGDLPWHKLCSAGSAVARIPQIRSKMLSWNGVRLVEGHPLVFGELLEYARCLGFDEPIDYDRFRLAFETLRDSEIEIKGNTSSSELIINPNAGSSHLFNRRDSLNLQRMSCFRWRSRFCSN